MQMRTRKAASILAVALVVAAFTSIPSLVQAQTPSKLIFTQVEIRGDEYVVIKNPGASSVDLANYYLTDATFAGGEQYYYNLPNAALPVGGGGFFDFVARFPAGATIGAGQEISVALNGSDGFFDSYGVMPHFELYEDGSSADDVPDMVDARSGSIVGDGSNTPTLSNSGEVVILFYWDGASDLVTDIDYVIWGDNTEAVDKTGITIDGPDADSTPSAYLPDTDVDSQELASFPSPTGVFVRVDESEGTQAASGSNGVDGRDETSENLATTFDVTDATPPGQTPEDNTAPTLISANGEQGSNQITVVFSEAVNAGAMTPANYQVVPIIGSITSIAVTSASFVSADGTTVALTLAENLAQGTGYSVIVNGVQDLAGNTIAADSEASFTTSSPGSFEVAGVYQFGADYVGVAYSAPVNAAQATNAANYSFSPSLSVSSVVLQDNGQTALVQVSSPLGANTTYGLTVTGVTSGSGEELAVAGPHNFTTASETVVNIATIQGNLGSYENQTVTVFGQVFITAASAGSTPSAYIQDASGRGINVFGTGDAAVLNDRGNVVKVTGLVETYFTTTELTGYTATLVKGDQPFLAPKVLSVAQAQSPNWEGTYIQTTSTLTSSPSASGSNNYNYEADGITFRVRNSTGISASSFSSGDRVTGAGAGSQFQTTFQIGVGNAEDFYKDTGVDTTPPTLVSAGGDAGATTVAVSFSENVGVGASTASNYTVTPAGGSAITVNSASVSGTNVTLQLASALVTSTQYTVAVSNVQDLAGNTISAGSNTTFTTGGAPGAFEVTGVFQFGADYVGVAFSEKVNTSQATQINNYSFSPSLTVASAAMQENGQTVILRTSSALAAGTSYALTVNGVTAQTGGGLGSAGPYNFQSVSGTVVNIADIQNNTSTYEGQTVTVAGQVFITGASAGSTPSAFIQDGSGRGLNVFGSGDAAAINDRGNVVAVTGLVEIYFTTTEITGYTATVLENDQPFLAPKVLTVAQAQSSDWEGTYIQTTSTLTGSPTASGSNNYNYEAQGITFRIRNAAGINASEFGSGDEVTGAGAGGAFQSTFQINVGHGEDFFKGSGGEDTTPPTLVSATGESGASALTVNFSETVGAGASTAANYQVTQTGGGTVSVNSAAAAGASVTLSLGSALESSTQYTVRVSNVQDAAGNTIAANSSVSFTTGSPGAFEMVGAFQFGADRIGVSFSDRVNPGNGTQIGNYTFSPNPGISSAELQDNGKTVIFTTDNNLPASTSYTVAVSGVTSQSGASLAAGAPIGFMTVSGTVVNIADIQTNTSTYDGQTVTVLGQVFMTGASNGGTPSAYIQDGSGRGINVFGSGTSAPLNDRGNVITVTGMIEIYFTTTEITGYTASVVTGGMPWLAPKTLTVAEVQSPQWEGTYIRTTSTLTGNPSASGSSNYNYPAEGLTFRVRNAAGVDPSSFRSGDTVTGAGAGAAFQSTFQITVGHSEDFGKSGGPGDTTPPTIGSATAEAGGNKVEVLFSEPVGTGADVIGNYEVFLTENPATTLGVQAARVNAAAVTLTVDRDLEQGTQYTVRVSNVQDLAGNTIVANSLASFTVGKAKPKGARLTVPPVTLVKDLRGEGEVIEIAIDGVAGDIGVLRIFDLQGRLVKVLYDGPVVGADPVEWDGRDQSFELVRAGTYICHLQTTNLAGHVTEDQAPIVVAVRLD